MDEKGRRIHLNFFAGSSISTVAVCVLPMRIQGGGGTSGGL